MTRRILRPLVLLILAAIYAAALALMIDERGSRHLAPAAGRMEQHVDGNQYGRKR